MAAEGDAGVSGRQSVRAPPLKSQAAVEGAATEARAGGHFTVAAATHRGAGLGMKALLTTPGEDLDHAAHGV